MQDVLTPAFLTSSSSHVLDAFHLGPCHWRMISWSWSLTILLWGLVQTHGASTLFLCLPHSRIVRTLKPRPFHVLHTWTSSSASAYSKATNGKAGWHWVAPPGGFFPGRWRTKGRQTLSLLGKTETSSLFNFLDFSETLKRDQDSGLWKLGVLTHQGSARKPAWSRPWPSVLGWWQWLCLLGIPSIQSEMLKSRNSKNSLIY